MGHGSGLLLGGGLVVTNNHVLPVENNYKQLVVWVRLGSRLRNPTRASIVGRDVLRDLALLSLSQTSTQQGCPIPVVTKASDTPMGTNLYVLGYPVNQDLSISDGLLSTHSGTLPPKQPRWQTNSTMNVGNSGGPVFHENGALVGFAVGGIDDWDIGKNTKVKISGVNFVIPVSEFVSSPLYNELTKLPANERCWQMPDRLAASATVKTTSPSDGSSRPPLSKITRSYEVRETKDDHPVALAPHSKVYEKKFVAEPGYRITGCTYAAESANKARDVACNIFDGGSRAVFSFRLESGPAIDRWRGWWGGSVNLAQELK